MQGEKKKNSSTLLFVFDCTLSLQKSDLLGTNYCLIQRRFIQKALLSSHLLLCLESSFVDAVSGCGQGKKAEEARGGGPFPSSDTTRGQRVSRLATFSHFSDLPRECVCMLTKKKKEGVNVSETVGRATLLPTISLGFCSCLYAFTNVPAQKSTYFAADLCARLSPGTNFFFFSFYFFLCFMAQQLNTEQYHI